MDASKSNGGPILIVVPSLGPNGAAKQVSLLAPALVGLGKSVHVAAIGAGGLFADVIRAGGVTVHPLGQKWRYELGPMLRLRRLIDDSKPASIHAWRGASRFVSALGWFRRLPPMITVDTFVHQSLSWLNRRLLRRANAVVVSGQWQRQQAV